MESSGGAKIASYRDDLREQLFDFLQRMYPRRDPASFPKMLQWLYFDNPDEPNPHQAIILALDGDQIVGHIGTMAMPYKLGSQIVLARLTLDLMVAPEHRTRGVGGRLLQESAARCELALGMGANPAARPVFRRMGWTSIPNPPIAVKMLSARYYVSRLTANRLLTATSHVLTKSFFRDRKSTLTYLARDSAVSLVPWSEFPKDIDGPLQTIVSESTFMQVRTSRRLNWRFARCPACDYGIFGIYRRDSLVGYVVLGLVRTPQDRRSGRIFDWQLFETDPELRHALWSACLDQLDKLGADHIRISLYPPEDTDSLRRAGFVLKDPLAVFIRQSRISEQDLCALAASGHIREGDSDAW